MKTKKPIRIIGALGVLLVIAYVALCCSSCRHLNEAMFHPPRDSYGRDLRGLVMAGTPDAPLATVWSPVPDAKRAVLFAHGNAEDLRWIHDRLGYFNRAGLSALAFDYPGFGLTPGEPTEESLYEAAEAAYRDLTENRGFAPADVIVCGYSLGSGPACWLAEKHDVGGLLLFAPFKSAVRVVTGIRILPFDPFPNLARVRRARCPVLVVHGEADGVINVSHGKAVAKAAGRRGRFIPIPGGSHTASCTALSTDDFR
ncbi:MAG: alpha/beta fold hydrolase, partial [Kiritimatiellae bacterium]|nr:alpha/beta fold hydrolase [Kiritimatiellia bacterium]